MKFVLIRNEEKEPISSGYCSPYPPEINKSIFVGSLTSRCGWHTTPIQKILTEDKMTFQTKNNVYHLIPLDDFYSLDSNS